ncbi:AMP nucleosidase [Estrella lausannensis]|uniref:Putative AMP nucleosidase n=1 Tax=Estrella lausannensis TaxID=483423 RepID=A0A0H5DQ93_9BACT|nr:AMP nucleosidase [Estrella lausannensis]CRX37709.1 Putative AMP nucleosidase [Estrella lausannensis]
MEDFKAYEPTKEEEKIAQDTLERYSGSPCQDYQPYLLLTNFPKYVNYFSESRGVPVIEGSMFSVAHSPEEKVSILDFKIGSPAAALVVDLVSFLPVKAALMLGMCGGLRRQYQVGDYFLPVASIRAEGTSDFYFHPEVPALANFLVQKAVTNVLERKKIHYHIGITHTTNKRFWEFNNEFKQKLKITRPQAIEMECATLFTASYYHKLPLGALLLISDLPLARDGIKTKASSENLFARYTPEHVETGVEVAKELDEAFKHQAKGVYRGFRRRFEKEEHHN